MEKSKELCIDCQNFLFVRETEGNIRIQKARIKLNKIEDILVSGD